MKWPDAVGSAAVDQLDDPTMVIVIKIIIIIIIGGNEDRDARQTNVRMDRSMDVTWRAGISTPK